MTTPDRIRNYRYLRASGWNARAAWAGSAPIAEPWDARARDLLDGNSAAEWDESGYHVVARLESDPYGGDVLGDYGTFTDQPGPDVIVNDRAGRNEYKFFRPSYSIAEATADNRKAGMSRVDARDAAFVSARADMLRALESAPSYMTVSVTLHDIELATASVGGLDANADPAAPYGVAQHLLVAYMAETLSELAAEALAEARAARPRIAAALAEDPEGSDRCANCGEPLYGTIRTHHHAENGEDVTRAIASEPPGVPMEMYGK